MIFHMEVKTILSWGYWFSALSLGLLLHPYPTLRKMVRDRLLRPLVMLPVVVTVGLWVTTVVLVHGGVWMIDWLGVATPGFIKWGLALFFWWAVWFLGLWQAVLGYLFVRFVRVLPRE